MTEINISKIKINENDLIIKDAQARENINSLSTNFFSSETLNNATFVQIGQTLDELSSSTQNINNNLNNLSTNLNNLSTNLNNLSTNLNSLSTNLNNLSINIDNNLNNLSNTDNKIKNSIADEFSTITSYSTNDLVLNDGNLYQFINDHEPGLWNSEEVEQTNLDNIMNIKQESWTTSPDPGCNLSSNNGIWRIGNLGCVKIVITSWSSTVQKPRTLYQNLSIIPSFGSFSYNVPLKKNNGVETGYININADRTISFNSDAAFSSTIIRACIIFPCVSNTTLI